MRTLLIADLHANLPALLKLPPADRIICAGDLVGYGPHPHEVLAALSDRAAAIVRGDEDDAVGSGVDHVEPTGLEEACRESRAWTRSTLGDTELAFLRRLPPEHEEVIDACRVAATHAYPGDYGRYISPTGEQLERIARAFPRANVIVIGHSHRPGIWRVGETLIVNPGSVGQPLRAGYASFAILEDRDVRLAEVQYDVLACAHDLRHLPWSTRARAQAINALVAGAERPFDRPARVLPMGA